MPQVAHKLCQCEKRVEAAARAGRFQRPAGQAGRGRDAGQARGGASKCAVHAELVAAHVTRDRGVRVFAAS